MTRSLEHARMLLRKAQDDAQVVAAALEDPAMADWIVGFHAQQAVEKSLKAVLSAIGAGYGYTHDLGVLLDALHDLGIVPPDLVETADDLTPFAGAIRYVEDPVDSPSAAFEREVVVELVQRTLDWASRLIRERDPARSR